MKKQDWLKAGALFLLPFGAIPAILYLWSKRKK